MVAIRWKQRFCPHAGPVNETDSIVAVSKEQSLSILFILNLHIMNSKIWCCSVFVQRFVAFTRGFFQPVVKMTTRSRYVFFELTNNLIPDPWHWHYHQSRVPKILAGFFILPSLSPRKRCLEYNNRAQVFVNAAESVYCALRQCPWLLAMNDKESIWGRSQGAFVVLLIIQARYLSMDKPATLLSFAIFSSTS